MKHKRTLLIVFFLTLFVFQQVQADATPPSAKNPSQINALPAKHEFNIEKQRSKQ